jgi:hypothetical protein
MATRKKRSLKVDSNADGNIKKHRKLEVFGIRSSVIRVALLCIAVAAIVLLFSCPDRCSDYYAGRNQYIAGRVLRKGMGRYGQYVVVGTNLRSKILGSTFSTLLIDMAMVGDSLYKASGADSGLIIRGIDRYHIEFLDYPPDCKKRYEAEKVRKE